MIKNLLFAFLLIFALTGCAPRISTIHLDAPNILNKQNLSVKDGRLDTQIYMVGISIGAQTHTYILNAEPSVDISLNNYLSADLANKTKLYKYSRAEVLIEEIDLKNKVGFGKPNELLCKIESTLSIYNDTNKPVTLKVKTLYKDIEDMSVLIETMGKKTLDPCLQKHAQEISSNFDNLKH
jgi:hypothetical protein